MGYQERTDIDNEPLVLGDGATFRNGFILASGHSGMVLGSVLGESISASGTYFRCDVASTSGMAYPKLILAETVSGSSGQTTVSAYEMGLFAETKLAFGGTTDLDSRVVISAANNINLTMRDAMRQMGLRIKDDTSVTGYENT